MVIKRAGGFFVFLPASLSETADALKNASSVGIYDIWGGNHLNEYKTTFEKQAYLQGRLNGDLLAILTGHSEMQVGGGIALTTGIETAGVGALAGGVLSLYGAGSAGVATADMTRILKELYQLNMSANGAADGSSGNQLKKYSKEPPVKSTKLKNDQGWRDKDGNIWKKDMKHKDHWDVSVEKTGKKVKEVDFDGNQIWPEGPKNKNKN